MLRYEALMLAIPEITQDETKAIESQLADVVKKAKGATVSFERWGKYRLAYPVKKNDYGVYFLARFEAEKVGDLLQDLKTVFTVKLNDIVMRNMITKLDANGSLEYQRPQSLEEAPSEDVSTLLRENRVKRLTSPSSHRRESARTEEKKEVEKEQAPAVQTTETPEA